MAKAACKYLLNNGLRALSLSLEQAMMSPLVRNVMMPEKDCDDVIQQLADIDLAIYHGLQVPHGGYRGIMQALTVKGVYTKEVWDLFA